MYLQLWKFTKHMFEGQTDRNNYQYFTHCNTHYGILTYVLLYIKQNYGIPVFKFLYNAI